VRVDLESDRTARQIILEDTSFLSYRVGEINVTSHPSKNQPDLILKPGKGKRALFVGQSLVLEGEWFEGEIQKVIVSLLVRELEKNDIHAFHSSAVEYRGKTILFMSGEENHGKTMSLIEACRRGAKIWGTESVLLDASGRILAGSRQVFLTRRSQGTERVDKPEPTVGTRKFFPNLPEFSYSNKSAGEVDFVILPHIDGNFDPFTSEMSQFEKEYQTYACLTSFYLPLNLIARGIPMPNVDSDELRYRRAKFVGSFASGRKYYLIRGSNPAVILDSLDSILDK